MALWTATLYGCTGETSSDYPTAAQIEAAGTYAKIQFGTDTDAEDITGTYMEPKLIDDNRTDISGKKRSKHVIKFQGILKIYPKEFPTSAKTLQKFWYIENGSGDAVLTKPFHYLMIQNTFYLQDKNVTPGTTYMKIAITDFTARNDPETGMKYLEIKFEKAGTE